MSMQAKSLSQFDAEASLRIRLASANLGLAQWVRAEEAAASIIQQATEAEATIVAKRDQFIDLYDAAIDVLEDMAEVPEDLADEAIRLGDERSRVTHSMA